MSANAWKARRFFRNLKKWEKTHDENADYSPKLSAEYDAVADKTYLFSLKREALSMMQCPYYKGEGTCSFGCYSEPSCITDAPLGGWERMARVGKEMEW